MAPTCRPRHSTVSGGNPGHHGQILWDDPSAGASINVDWMFSANNVQMEYQMDGTGTTYTITSPYAFTDIGGSTYQTYSYFSFYSQIPNWGVAWEGHYLYYRFKYVVFAGQSFTYSSWDWIQVISHAPDMSHLVQGRDYWYSYTENQPIDVYIWVSDSQGITDIRFKYAIWRTSVSHPGRPPVGSDYILYASPQWDDSDPNTTCTLITSNSTSSEYKLTVLLSGWQSYLYIDPMYGALTISPTGSMRKTPTCGAVRLTGWAQD